MSFLKINEVESLVGITKKNIRFYEDQGLLTPRRNRENGYRDYGEADIETLRRIKLLRKLGFPLEEIRQMQGGMRTVGDGMRRHLSRLEQAREDLAAAARLCGELADCPVRLSDLDAVPLLTRMEEMEQEGTTFMDKQKHDARGSRYAAPVIVTVLMILLMSGCIWLILWAVARDPGQSPPLPLVALMAVIPVIVILGVLLALVLRIREIRRGEEDEARKY